MSTAAKLFTILGMIGNILAGLMLGLAGILEMTVGGPGIIMGLIAIFGAMIAIIPTTIIGVKAIGEIDLMFPSTTISILTLFFVNPIAGILMLCMGRNY